MMNCSVLIVDDSPLLRATIKRAVIQAGVDRAQIREAGNGQEALDALSAEKSDLVLLDLNMPVMNGFEFAQARAEAPELKDVQVIVVTTEGNKDRLEQLRGLGVRDFLRKPFEPEDLRELVRDLEN